MPSLIIMGQIFYPEPIEENYIPNILKEIYMDKVYEPYLRGKKNLVICDLGANIGLTTMYFYRFAETVYSVEPATENFNFLKENIKTNKIENVKLYQMAISHENKEVILHHSANKTMHSLTGDHSAVSNEKPSSEKVKGITIEQFMKDNKIDHIDLLKLDIEGSEPEVLCSDSFRKVADKIDVLVYEYHVWSNRVPSQINNCLKDMGFYVSQLPCEATVFVCTKIK